MYKQGKYFQQGEWGENWPLKIGDLQRHLVDLSSSSFYFIKRPVASERMTVKLVTATPSTPLLVSGSGSGVVASGRQA